MPTPPKYLLAAQVLLELCAAELNRAQTWFSAQDPAHLRVSVISVAKARHAVQHVDLPAHTRSQLLATLDTLLADLASDGGEPLAFTAEHARMWEALMSEPSLEGIGITDRMVCATALHEGLTLVDTLPAHVAALRRQGLTCLVP